MGGIADNFAESGSFKGLHLERVLIAPGQPAASAQVVTVEIYEDGLIVRLLIPEGLNTAERDPDELMQNPMGKGSLMLSDDAGTKYRNCGGGGTEGQGGPYRGDTQFVPAPPAEAKLLTVVTVDGPVPIDLSADG